MQQWDCDATDAMTKATVQLINQYSKTIDRYDMDDEQIYNFLCDRNKTFKKLCDEYLSTQK